MGVPTGALGLTLTAETTPGSDIYDLVVGQVGDVSGMDTGTDRTEVTSHDAALAGRRRIYVTTLGKEFSLAFPLFFDSSDTAHETIQGDGIAGITRGYRVQLTDTGTEILTFDGHVTGFEITASVEGANQANVTISGTGDIVIT